MRTAGFGTSWFRGWPSTSFILAGRPPRTFPRGAAIPLSITSRTCFSPSSRRWRRWSGRWPTVRGKDYRRLDSWLRLGVRYTLAFTMFTYGFAKVFPLQFQPPGFQKLTEPYGDFSPMGVLWSFMGASMAYTIFAGMCEVVGGTLLLFRRTTTLGAMVSFGVLLNIALLNFCYDVPVKLYSANLVLMAIFLAAPDLRRLLNFLVLNHMLKPVPPGRRWMRIGAVVFQVLFVGYFIYSEIEGGWTAYKETYINPKRPPNHPRFPSR